MPSLRVRRKAVGIWDEAVSLLCLLPVSPKPAPKPVWSPGMKRLCSVPPLSFPSNPTSSTHIDDTHTLVVVVVAGPACMLLLCSVAP